jgi:L,D-transpeptidase ErfK/SrfK
LPLLLAALLLPSSAAAVVWPLPPETEVVGELIQDRLRHEDTLLDMARMHNIGQLEMRAANPELDPWLPKPGASVIVPQLHVLPEVDREGIVVNLSERRLYYFSSAWPDRDGPVVSTHPVGVGLLDRATPLTRTRVTARLDQPAWYPNEETRAWYRSVKNETLPLMVPPGPENPLGEHALILDDDGLMIHGTHRPAGVGMRVSQGCIRLYPESIAALIQQIPVGTPVLIVDQPIRLGWRDGALYLEVDPAEGDDIDRFRPGEWPRHPEALWQELRQRVLDRIEQRAAALDLDRARAAFERADGIPVEIARVSGSLVSQP